MKAKLLYSIAFSLLLLFTYCAEEEECPDTNIPDLYAAFIKNDHQEISQAIIYNQQLPDSIFLNEQVNSDTIYIPLNIAKDTTDLNFDVTYKYYEKKYSNKLYLIHSHSISSTNIECGFSVQFLLKEIDYKSSLIDSVVILDSIVNSDIKIHAKIYYSNNDMRHYDEWQLSE